MISRTIQAIWNYASDSRFLSIES
uniref:Uncharacterized protein n=1 Tax=Rhizophora mucronata TaxID=61149 RepID=A0A2P2MIE8_RHIMU